jgi:hypothetical protein
MPYLQGRVYQSHPHTTDLAHPNHPDFHSSNPQSKIYLPGCSEQPGRLSFHPSNPKSPVLTTSSNRGISLVMFPPDPAKK